MGTASNKPVKVPPGGKQAPSAPRNQAVTRKLAQIAASKTSSGQLPGGRKKPPRGI